MVETPRSRAVFVIGIAALIALWLPPLFVISDFGFRISDFPGHLRARGERPIYWDYFIVPILVVCAFRVAWKSRPSLAESGLTGANFLGAIKLLALPTLLGAVFLLGFGACCNSIDITPRFWKRFLLNSAIFQQMVIQLFFHRQLMPWFGAGRKTAWILTLFFAALHAPNPGLMLGTFIGMYFWTRCYQRQPNLYALAISQALLSALLMHTMPKWMLPSVSVGLRFVEKVGWLCR